MTAKKLATIGVYGFTLEEFLRSLRDADVRLVLDVRQRRGVRGPQYAWANSKRLQSALAEAGIDYRHHPELAPTTDLRQLQYREDDRLGVGKRSREQLAPEYRERYTREILDHADLDGVVAELPEAGAGALLCVERDPEACHRSLVADRIAAEYRVPVTHLRPSILGCNRVRDVRLRTYMRSVANLLRGARRLPCPLLPCRRRAGYGCSTRAGLHSSLHLSRGWSKDERADASTRIRPAVSNEIRQCRVAPEQPLRRVRSPVARSAPLRRSRRSARNRLVRWTVRAHPPAA